VEYSCNKGVFMSKKCVRGGRALVPVRVVAESFGAKVD